MNATKKQEGPLAGKTLRTDPIYDQDGKITSYEITFSLTPEEFVWFACKVKEYVKNTREHLGFNRTAIMARRVVIAWMANHGFARGENDVSEQDGVL